MNEVKKIHLGRQQFTIAVDAHKALRDYLEAIRKQPGVQPEVVEEVEMRMAELLAERGVTADKVVLPADIDFLKGQLGEPKDFKDEAGEAGDEAAADNAGETAGAGQTENGPRRLYRDTENAWLAGVASGLGAYLGIDALIVRVAFIALTFASGFGIVLYLVLWLLAPEAKTPSERLQMQGKAVTVDSLKEMVERADISGAGERAGRKAGNAGRKAGRAVGRVVELIFRAVLVVIGAMFVLGGIATMLWTFASGAYLLLHGGQIGTEIAFPIGAREVWFVILAFLTAFIFGFLILMSGLTMTTRRWRLPVWSVVALLSIFFVAGGIGTALGFDTVPNIAERYRQAHHTQTRELPEFSNLSIQGEDTTVTFKPDSKYSVEVSFLGDVDTKPLATVVEDGTLKIDSREFTKQPLCSGICFYSDRDLKITVRAPKLDSVKLDGETNDFRTGEQLRQDSLKLEITRENIAHIDGVRVLDVKTAERCDESEPMVYAGGRTAEIKVNGKVIVAEEQLRSYRSPDERNDYNCVVFR